MTDQSMEMRLTFFFPFFILARYQRSQHSVFLIFILAIYNSLGSEWIKESLYELQLKTLPLPCCLIIIEPSHDKTNKMTFAPSEDSDQPGHSPSLIRVFAVRIKETLGPQLHFERTAKTLIRLGGCTG